jgi:proteasome lid subunit RPN8/RPN11
MKKTTGAFTPRRTQIVEQSWVLTGYQDELLNWHFRRRKRSIGELASVQAAWEWALGREEHKGDVVGFFHTHPRGAGAQPSSRDIRTMRAWCSSFGKPLLCVIAEGKILYCCIFTSTDEKPKQVKHITKGEQGWYFVKF